MSIVLVAIIVTVVGVYIAQAFNGFAYLSGQKGMSAQASSAMYKILKEIKTANKSVNISTFTAEQLTFNDLANNSVTFSKNGTNLMRNSDILLNNLKNPGGLVFTYLTSTEGTALTNNQIRVIKVKISTLSSQNQFIIESSARLRIL